MNYITLLHIYICFLVIFTNFLMRKFQ
uniref:Uncharacterized protein n=1 Tax=Anguilla anguilla TaxID=7936 RepID=A0A0E9WA86_ANGAN